MTDIRPATPRDAPAIHAIYAPIVSSTHISFVVDNQSAEAAKA